MNKCVFYCNRSSKSSKSNIKSNNSKMQLKVTGRAKPPDRHGRQMAKGIHQQQKINER
jgi:hypothetical protein